jgi:hypothetical protein
MSWEVIVLPTIIPSIAVVIAAFITTRKQDRIHQVVQEVKNEVKTTNGSSIAQIIESAEERRVNGDAVSVGSSEEIPVDEAPGHS